jgi:DNA-binding IclR family transcriptional regulator
VLEGHELVTVAMLESPEPVRVSLPRSRRVPYNFGAYGKALLAFMDADTMERLLRAHPPRALTTRTPVARERLREALEVVRRRGFAFSDGEAIAGTRAVAAPVRDHHGRPVGALGVSFPNAEATRAHVQSLGRLARDVAARLSAQLGAARGRARSLEV